jgi:hypothetical protein
MQEPRVREQSILDELNDTKSGTEVYALLAQANLLRIRACWDEAIEKCMQAMRIAPGNFSAHSLLGDIYENKGCFDDAIQWYQMALDINPESTADHLKLTRLLDAKSTIASKNPIANAKPLAPAMSQPLSKTAERFYARPEMFLRIAALLSILLIIIVLLFGISRHRAAIKESAFSETQQIDSDPLVAPPNNETPGDDQSNSVTMPRDSNDQALLDVLKTAPECTGAGMLLTDVQTDPRQGRVVITMLASQANINRDSIMRNALHVLQAASRVTDSQTIGNFTVRYLLSTNVPSGSISSPLVFMADAGRTSIPSAETDVTTLPSSTIEAIYTNPWWSRAIQE